MSVAQTAISEYGALQKRGELERLLKIIERTQPRVIVEIGTDSGGTLYAICQTAPDDALIVSIDNSYHTYALNAALSNVTEYRESFKKPDQELRFLHANTHDDTTLEYLKEMLGGRAVDFMFIDGDHSYEGVKQDWEMYSPLVSGMVAFHDINEHTELSCNVKRFWDELKLQVAVFAEILEDPRHDDGHGTWAGIGVVKT